MTAAADLLTAALEMKLALTTYIRDDLTAVEKKTTLGAPVVSYRLIRYYARLLYSRDEPYVNRVSRCEVRWVTRLWSTSR